MKVAIYARVSTKEQTTETQIAELEDVASRMGATSVVIFKDDGISGIKGRDERDGLNQLLKAATRREVDKVLVWSVDRLGRSLKHLVSTLEDLEQTGCGLYLHKQAIDTTTASGKALFGMLAVFSQFEREMIRERINAGLARARANGVKLGRRNSTGHLAKQVQTMRQQGLSVRSIASQLGISTYSVSVLGRSCYEHQAEMAV